MKAICFVGEKETICLCVLGREKTFFFFCAKYCKCESHPSNCCDKMTTNDKATKDNAILLDCVWMAYG